MLVTPWATISAADLVNIGWVALGAVPGALCRYYFSLWALQTFGSRFPWWTMVINISGTFLIGLIAMFLVEPGDGGLKLMLTTGFLGAYTTFSTYALDTTNLSRSSSRTLTLFYGVGSPVLGLLGGYLGAWLGTIGAT